MRQNLTSFPGSFLKVPEMEPHGLTAVVPPCFGDIPPKHPRQNAAGLSLAFILGLTPEVFCEGGIKKRLTRFLSDA